MLPWTFYPAFIATATSMIALSGIAFRQHNREQPRTLSELAAAHDHVLRHFQKILWLCGTLFAITTYGFICPRISQPALTVVAWSMVYIGEMLLACVPARGKTHRLHTVFGEMMGVGMLALAYVFWQTLHGAYPSIELGISVAMTVFGFMTILDKKRFILYELTFIYLSHVSILVAALALR